MHVAAEWGEQEGRHVSDFPVFSSNWKLAGRGGEEKIIAMLGSFLFPVSGKWGLLSQSIIHSDVQKLFPLCFAAWREDMQEKCKLRIFCFILFECYLHRDTLTSSALHGVCAQVWACP